MSGRFLTLPPHGFLASAPEKRARPHCDHPAMSLDQRTLKRSFVSLTPSQDVYFAKKLRADAEDPDFSSCLSSIVDGPPLTKSPVTTDSLDFGDIVTDFASDTTHPILDTFLMDLPIAESDAAQQREANSQASTLCDASDSLPTSTSPVSSPVSSGSPPAKVASLNVSESSSPPCSSEDLHGGLEKDKEHDGDASSFHEKRLADRAARNRESSRRAREKAKQRLRALENQNRSLLDLVQRYKMENEELYSQLHRARTLQQGCSMCSFNAANQRVALSCPSQPHNTVRVDRCATESCRPQMRIDPSYSTSV